MTTSVAPPTPLSKTTPWAHQLHAYQFAAARPAAYLAMGMGTGKSKVVVDLAVNQGWRRTLIVCPLSVVPVWPDQFARHGAAYIHVLPLGDGPVARRTAAANASWDAPHPLAVVVNYAGLIAEPFRTWALGRRWDALVADEAHHTGAPGGVLSRLLALLRSRSARRLALSGTPMPHSPLDLYGQYRWLDPTIYGNSYTRYRARYAVMGGFGGHEVKGWQNMAELERRAASIMYQAGREVLDLPDANHVEARVSLSGGAAKVYRDLERRFVADLEDGRITVANALTKLLRLQQLTGGTLETDDGQMQRVDEAKEVWLREWLSGVAEPCVVFARFRADLDRVRAAAAASGHVCLEHSGRDHTGLAEWQAGRAAVLAVQIQAGGEGIDLTRARLAVYYSKGFSLGDYTQSLARLHRPGQHRPVTYYHLVAQDTVDQKLERALAERQDVVTSVLKEMRHV